MSTGQRSSFLQTWNRLPPLMREIAFDLHGPGWTPTVITQLGKVLAEFLHMFSKSSTYLGSFSLLPFEIEVLRTALPQRLGPTVSIFRPPRQWTRF